MKPADSSPPERTPDKSESPQPRKIPNSRWAMTQEAFDKLLERLSPDREKAGNEFVAIKTKLSRYFESRRVDSAETCVDIVIDRVTRKIDEGVHIENLIGYFYKVAYLVYLEGLRHPQLIELDSDSIPAPTPEPFSEEEERRQRCFDDCLAKLSEKSRDLILTYHREDGHDKIVLRKQLATRLRIPLNALRIRAHRIRVGLEKCIKVCLLTRVIGRNVNG